jgi:hypothetical protein
MHSDQAKRVGFETIGFGDTNSVVTNFDDQFAFIFAYRNAGSACASMLGNVGQSLLNDPEYRRTAVS